MQRRTPPSKTWLYSSNVVIFPCPLRLVLDDTKQLTTSEIIEQIHELNMEDCRISRNQ